MILDRCIIVQGISHSLSGPSAFLLGVPLVLFTVLLSTFPGYSIRFLRVGNVSLLFAVVSLASRTW